MMTETASILSNRKAEILAHFVCQNSGNCCRYEEGVVYVNAPEAAQMAGVMKLDVPTFMSRYVRRRNGWMMVSDRTHRPDCFLDECSRCQVYEARPAACRTYPDWPTIWESDEAVRWEAASCPGLAAAIVQVGLS